MLAKDPKLKVLSPSDDSLNRDALILQQHADAE